MTQEHDSFLMIELLIKNEEKINELYATGKNRIVLVIEKNLLQRRSIEHSIKQTGIMFHEIIKDAFPNDMRLITTKDQLFKIA